MKSLVKDIKAFYKKFKLPIATTPRLLDAATAAHRIKFMREEIDEYAKASRSGDIVEQADALADLIYVAVGTAVWQGIPLEEVWDEVHSSNMRKVRAKDASESKRGTQYDVIKPDGWCPPNISAVIIHKLMRELHARRHHGSRSQTNS